MSLLDRAQALDNSGFDPNKGKEAGGFTPIPAGTYTVNFNGITHNAKNGHDFLMLTFEVMDGKEVGRKENILPTLALTTSKGNPMPDFVIDRSISIIKVVGAMCDIVVPNTVFAFDNETDAYEAIVPVLRPGIGTLMKMTITETPNKKNPDNPNRNYKFSKIEQPSLPPVEDPFKDAETGEELDTSKIPFDVSDMTGDGE